MHTRHETTLFVVMAGLGTLAVSPGCKSTPNPPNAASASTAPSTAPDATPPDATPSDATPPDAPPPEPTTTKTASGEGVNTVDPAPSKDPSICDDGIKNGDSCDGSVSVCDVAKRKTQTCPPPSYECENGKWRMMPMPTCNPPPPPPRYNPPAPK